MSHHGTVPSPCPFIAICHSATLDQVTLAKPQENAVRPPARRQDRPAAQVGVAPDPTIPKPAPAVETSPAVFRGVLRRCTHCFTVLYCFTPSVSTRQDRLWLLESTMGGPPGVGAGSIVVGIFGSLFFSLSLLLSCRSRCCAPPRWTFLPFPADFPFFFLFPIGCHWRSNI